MNPIIREMFGSLLNPLNENRSGKELILHPNSRDRSNNIESDIDILANNLGDELTPFIEAFPMYSQEKPKVSVTQNLYEEIFTDSIVKSLVEDQVKGIVTSPRESIFDVPKALNKLLQSHPTVVVPNKLEGLTQYFNSIADMTVREIFQKILDCSIIENIQMAELGIVALKLITFSFIFKNTVRLYAKVAYPQATKTVEEAVLRRREIRFFMVYGALPISLAIYNIGNLTFRGLLTDRVLEATNSCSKEELLQLGSNIQNGISKSGVLSFLCSQTPNWLILIIALFLVTVYYNPYNIVHYIFNLVQMYSYVFIIFLLLGQIFMILYYTMSFIFLQMTLNNKVTISKSLPKFIKSRLLLYSNLTNEGKIRVSRSNKRNIWIYICIFICTLIMYLLGVYS